MTAQGVTQMRREIDQIPDTVERALRLGADQLDIVAERIRILDPPVFVTAARGSSDHVCALLNYVVALLLGRPVASLGPSIASIYRAQMTLSGAVSVSISQSGASPDIAALTAMARRSGAFCVAITNEADSALAAEADETLALHAGPELSVAATKTFAASVAVCLALVARIARDDALSRALSAAPEALARAARIDWPEARAALAGRVSLLTLGRGPTLAVANEAALKFKETCRIHAESFSAAEMRHGPVSLVDEGYPLIAFAVEDAAETSLAEAADALAAQGATVYATSDAVTRAARLDHIRTGHPMTDALSLIVSFYAMVERVAVESGANPDAPQNLSKVTRTL